MKKKIILPVVLVASMVMAPSAKAGLMGDLSDLTSIINNVTQMVLEGFGFESVAQGIQNFDAALREGMKELDKPAGEMDIKKLTAILAKTNKIAAAMNDDLERITKVLLKPLAKILPHGKEPVMTITNKETGEQTPIYLDELPNFITEKMFNILGKYYQLTAKLLNKLAGIEEEVIIPEGMMDHEERIKLIQEKLDLKKEKELEVKKRKKAAQTNE